MGRSGRQSQNSGGPCSGPKGRAGSDRPVLAAPLARAGQVLPTSQAYTKHKPSTSSPSDPAHRCKNGTISPGAFPLTWSCLRSSLTKTGS